MKVRLCDSCMSYKKALENSVSTWMGERVALSWDPIKHTVGQPDVGFFSHLYNFGYSRKFDISINQKLPLNQEALMREI